MPDAEADAAPPAITSEALPRTATALPSNFALICIYPSLFSGFTA
jgi:hypothetical protein